MNEPKRREQRRTHLDASAVPVERALLARAEELHEAASDAADDEQRLAHVVAATLGTEFERLAEELHWWG